MAKAPHTPPADGGADLAGAEAGSASSRRTSNATDTAPATEFPDVEALSYEDARDELSAIVAQLEGGQLPLEEGMRLWRRGEALAAHCTSWLDGAQRQISESGPASAP